MIIRADNVIELQEEIHLKGVPLSEGIAIGLLYFLQPDEKWAVPEFSITTNEVPKEIARYRTALSLCREELQRLQFCLAKEGSSDAVKILDAHILMLDDPVIVEIENKISKQLRNTESIFKATIDDYVHVFESMHNGQGEEMTHQRLLDVKDLSTKILRHLHPEVNKSPHIPSHSIVAAYELVPSQTAEASPNHIRAFVTEVGGFTCHAGVIARAKGIPYISDIDVRLLEKWNRQSAIIDGYLGVVIINPREETLKKYHEKKNTSEKHYVDIGLTLPEEVKTIDGVSIDVQANLESFHDLHLIKEYKVHSIGLVRSEFLYLKKGIEEFYEEEQFELYKKLMQMAGQMEIGFRFFDIGNDKRFFQAGDREPNPALGCRSIRFLLAHPGLFLSQIRAILRASSFGNVKFLLPLVSDISELREAKKLIFAERDQLKKEGHLVPSEIRVGCMVEVPAFVIMCDQMILECDFLSIGTNDLIQYSLVADRSNPETCNKYGPCHPSILRMIKICVEEGKKNGKPVSICGELASDPKYTELLIGLGVTTLSCSPRHIPLIKKAISDVYLKKAQEIAHKAMGF